MTITVLPVRVQVWQMQAWRCITPGDSQLTQLLMLLSKLLCRLLSWVLFASTQVDPAPQQEDYRAEAEAGRGSRRQRRLLPQAAPPAGARQLQLLLHVKHGAAARQVGAGRQSGRQVQVKETGWR